MVRVHLRVYVCVSASCLCKKYMSHYQTSFSALSSLLVGYGNHLKAKARVLPLFFPDCFVGTLASVIRVGVSWDGRHCSSRLVWAGCWQGQLEMKLLLSAICLTL